MPVRIQHDVRKSLVANRLSMADAIQLGNGRVGMKIEITIQEDSVAEHRSLEKVVQDEINILEKAVYELSKKRSEFISQSERLKQLLKQASIKR